MEEYENILIYMLRELQDFHTEEHEDILIYLLREWQDFFMMVGS